MKIKLNDDAVLDCENSENDLDIIFSNQSVEDLDKLFTKDNCTKIELLNNKEEVYGVYNNMECTSIELLEDDRVAVHLKQLDDTYVKIQNLEGAVEDLGNVVSELAGGDN